MKKKRKNKKFGDFCNKQPSCSSCELHELGYCIAPIDRKDNDNVNHPSHYEGEIECIDAMIQTQGVDASRVFALSMRSNICGDGRTKMVLRT